MKRGYFTPKSIPELSSLKRVYPLKQISIVFLGDESESEEDDEEESDVEEAPRLLWLLVVVNGLIIAIAVVICRLCSYQGVQSDSPYTYLPGK